MVKFSRPKFIRKRPRRFHKFQAILSASHNDCECCEICNECWEKFASQAEHDRPGHLWRVEDGKIIYIEDDIAAQVLGRPLNNHEVVVHRNNKPLDNRKENLDIVTIPETEGN
jgi:hypothetical protein